MLTTRSDEIVSKLEFSGGRKGTGFSIDLVQVHEETEMSRDWNEIMATGESDIGAMEALENLAKDCGCPVENDESSKRGLQDEEVQTSKKRRMC